MGSKWLVLVPLAGDQANEAAGFQALGEALEHVVQAVELHPLGIGNGPVDFGAEHHEVIHEGLAAHSPGLIAAADEQVTHGDVQALDGGPAFLGAGAVLTTYWNHPAKVISDARRRKNAVRHRGESRKPSRPGAGNRKGW